MYVFFYLVLDGDIDFSPRLDRGHISGDPPPFAHLKGVGGYKSKKQKAKGRKEEEKKEEKKEE